MVERLESRRSAPICWWLTPVATPPPGSGVVILQLEAFAWAGASLSVLPYRTTALAWLKAGNVAKMRLMRVNVS